MYLRLLLILLLIPAVAAQPVNDFNDVAELDIDFTLSSDIDLVPTGDGAAVEFIMANVSFFPRDHLWQQVSGLSAHADAAVTSSELDYTFFWDAPNSARDMRFSLTSQLHNTNVLHLVEQKVPFPVTVTDPYYTQQTEYMDITPEIEAQALALAAGEDDLYQVTYNVANWVESNIDYDLSTLTAEVVQPSSWVLANRQGVCDELTNLFISMMRSLDVPTRYVSGLAYTNTLHDWGPHAWAEVYFPNVGWVPFDVTYGQFGWIDPSHIKLRESVDSGDATIKYLWRSTQIDFLPQEIDLDATLISSTGRVQPMVNLSLTPLVEKVGPGSYVPFVVDVENRQDYYLPLSLYVTKAQQLVEQNVRRVLLLPHGAEKIYWIMQVPSDLENGYLYTTTIEVQDTFHSSVSTNISYATNYPAYSLVDAQELLSEAAIADARVPAEGLLVQCSVPSSVYAYEEVSLDCTLKNLGVVDLSLSVCALDDCVDVTVAAASLEIVSLTLPAHAQGTHTVAVDVTGDVVAREQVVFSVLSNVGVELVDIEFPQELSFSDVSDLSFTISAQEPVEDFVGYFNNKPLLHLDSLDDSQRVSFSAEGKQLYLTDGMNVTFFFLDASGKTNIFSKQLRVDVTDVPWYMKALRVVLFMNR